jgi:hypothetical protein
MAGYNPRQLICRSFDGTAVQPFSLSLLEETRAHSEKSWVMVLAGLKKFSEQGQDSAGRN